MAHKLFELPQVYPQICTKYAQNIKKNYNKSSKHLPQPKTKGAPLTEKRSHQITTKSWRSFCNPRVSTGQYCFHQGLRHGRCFISLSLEIQQATVAKAISQVGPGIGMICIPAVCKGRKNSGSIVEANTSGNLPSVLCCVRIERLLTRQCVL